MRAGSSHERRVPHGTGEDARSTVVALLLVIVMLCTAVSSQDSSTEYTFRSGLNSCW